MLRAPPTRRETFRGGASASHASADTAVRAAEESLAAERRARDELREERQRASEVASAAAAESAMLQQHWSERAAEAVAHERRTNDALRAELSLREQEVSDLRSALAAAESRIERLTFGGATSVGRPGVPPPLPPPHSALPCCGELC